MASGDKGRLVPLHTDIYIYIYIYIYILSKYLGSLEHHGTLFWMALGDKGRVVPRTTPHGHIYIYIIKISWVIRTSWNHRKIVVSRAGM